ncbi:MAG: hypothetical protein V3V08_15580 [Nannocystaceae bacterium]
MTAGERVTLCSAMVLVATLLTLAGAFVVDDEVAAHDHRADDARGGTTRQHVALLAFVLPSAAGVAYGVGRAWRDTASKARDNG